MKILSRLCGVFLLAWAGGLFAYEQIFTAASRQDPFDSAGASARASGLGGAFVGVADDSAAVLFNPAGLAGIRRGDLSVHHLSGLAGISQDLAVMAMPVRERFGIGIYAHYVNYGTFEGRSETGEALPDYRANQLGLGAGGGLKLTGGLTFGASFRGSQQTFAGNAYALFNADAGFLFRTDGGWRLGVSYCNLGVNRGADDSATAFRVGASRHFEAGRSFSVLAAAASSLEPKNGNRLLFGLEGSYKSVGFLRVGYRMNLRETGLNGPQGFTAGAGIAYKDTRLDYSFEPFADIGTTHRISLVQLFGREREAPQAAQNQPPPSPVTVVQTVMQPLPATAAGFVTPEPVQPSPPSATPSPGEMLNLVFTLPSEDLAKGEELEKQGKDQEAFQAYLSAVQKDKRNTRAWYKLGGLYHRHRMKEQAVRCFEEVIRLNPNEKALADWLTKYKAETAPKQ